jgi:hypothetical protein
MNYANFLDKKTQLGTFDGFEPLWLPDFLFDFQRHLVDWSIRKGKSAIFADCGLGKTPMQLVWAQNVVQKTNRPVLILTPLAVSHQTIAEAEKFGIEVSRNKQSLYPRNKQKIIITNYEQLHQFSPHDFIGCVCDESSILKSYDGKRRGEITEFMRKMPYRLLATATAAPNDYIELGTSSEALGELGHLDMLQRFFRHVDNISVSGGAASGHQFRFKHKERQLAFEGKASMWRFKGHAEIPFWRWVSSWARALRRPSDLGFSDDGFILPPLQEHEHLVEANTLAQGMLFALPAIGLKEQRDERRRTIQERCEHVAELVRDTKQPALIWCHLNDEGDLLEQIIPDCVQVSGNDSDENKEAKFMTFAAGAARVLVTKPKIGAWGLNFQHCAHVTFFPSHSFEQYYQGVRRCWRFGQKRPVRVDVITTEGERGVMQNLQRKAAAADLMFSSLVAEMSNAVSISRSNTFHQREEIPAWL